MRGKGGKRHKRGHKRIRVPKTTATECDKIAPQIDETSAATNNTA
jgi:hypothetical protein